MSLTRLLVLTLSWAVVGFIIGVALGVTTVSVWLVAIGLGVYLLYLRLLGPAHYTTEGWLFAAGPLLIMSWMAGFIVRGIV